MLETRAVVVQIDGRIAVVRADRPNGCDQCNGKGCGTGKLSQLFCSKPRQFKVDNSIDAGVGDEVVVAVADGAVMHGIGLVYLLPLLLMVAGAMVGNNEGSRPDLADGYAAAGALAGLAAGFVAVRWISLRQAGSRYRPYISRMRPEE